MTGGPIGTVLLGICACCVGWMMGGAATAAGPANPGAGPDPAPAPLTVRVDRREELFSILFRLAGSPEYRRAAASQYAYDVDAHFEPWKDHPAVRASRQLREIHSIGFDAPQSLLVYLDEQLRPRRALVPAPPGLDRRWAKVDIPEYLARVRDFARISGFSDFFAAHAVYFRAVEQSLRAPLEAQGTAWFDGFFGHQAGAQSIVVPGLLNGPSSYGPRAEIEGAPPEFYQVLGMNRLDGQDLPVVDRTTVELLAHELAHSYVNPLLDRHQDRLGPALAKLYALVEAPMRAQNYAEPRTLGNESLVRAVTVLFAKDHTGPGRAEAVVREQIGRSFWWTGDLARLLEEYRADRRAYPDLEAFIPRLAAFFEQSSRTYQARVSRP